MVSRSRTYTDDNFLGGLLTITVDENKKITEGTLCFPQEDCCCHYYDDTDEEEEIPCTQHMSFYAVTKCAKTDDFDIVKGMDIVKLKIAKQYYSNIKRKAKKIIMEMNECIKEYERDYEFASRKVANIQEALTDKGFSFYGVKPKALPKSPKKVVKKTTTKK